MDWLRSMKTCRGVLLALLVGVTVTAQERIRLTAPETVTADTVTIQFVGLYPAIGQIDIVLTTNAGQRIVHHYGPPQGVTMLRALNKADLSTRSLQQRILDRLVADGVIAGAVEGTPQ